MKKYFVRYLKVKAKKETLLHIAEINMAKKPQIA